MDKKLQGYIDKLNKLKKKCTTETSSLHGKRQMTN